MLGGFVLERKEVVYRLGGVDPERGVDVYDLVKYLSKFSDLVRETVRETGYTGELKIRVRPFREGSFITEFIIEGGLVGLLSGDTATSITNALSMLGFCGGAVAGIPKIVKAVKGKIEKFKDNGDGTYTYGSGTESVTVDKTTHDVVQSPKIADLYGNVAVGPIAEFNGAVEQVNIYVMDRSKNDDGISDGANFTRREAKDMAAYSKSAKLMADLDVTETVSTTNGIWLRPVSGSYGGAQKGYTFSYGQGDEQKTYKKVSIEDEGFLEDLASGAVRLNAGDLLLVDLETTQRISRSGNMTATHRITSVREYRAVPIPHQATFSEYLEGAGAESGDA